MEPNQPGAVLAPDDPDRPGIIGATQVPVHGDFLANLVGPFLVAGAGTAFSFIPISVAALAGVTEHESGLASGLLNTSMQIGGAIGTAIASSVAASGTNTLLRAGNPLTNALTGRFRQTFWVPGAIALIAPPAVLMLTRRARSPHTTSKPASGQAEPALATTK
ncbi:MAG: MFS transporter [Solirubrobacteraceae bacterium]